jgi:hypothetical protein
VNKSIVDKPANLAGVLERVEDKLAPVQFIVPLQGSLAVALFSYAMQSGVQPETIMAEALRAYLGDA